MLGTDTKENQTQNRFHADSLKQAAFREQSPSRIQHQTENVVPVSTDDLEEETNRLTAARALIRANRLAANVSPN